MKAFSNRKPSATRPVEVVLHPPSGELPGNNLGASQPFMLFFIFRSLPAAFAMPDFPQFLTTERQFVSDCIFLSLFLASLQVLNSCLQQTSQFQRHIQHFALFTLRKSLLLTAMEETLSQWYCPQVSCLESLADKAFHLQLHF